MPGGQRFRDGTHHHTHAGAGFVAYFPYIPVITLRAANHAVTANLPAAPAIMTYRRLRIVAKSRHYIAIWH